MIPDNPNISKEQAAYLVYGPHVTDEACVGSWMQVKITANGFNSHGPTVNTALGWIKGDLARFVAQKWAAGAKEGLNLHFTRIEVTAGPTPDVNGCGPKESPAQASR